MDLRQLTYFVAIVEEGSITAAAQRLHMSQPPLSLTVAQLEKELGVALLHRHARGVTPTEAGLHLVAHSRRLLTDADRLREALAAMGEGSSGELRVGAEPIGYWNLVSRHIERFGQAFPDVTLSLVDTTPGPLLELVRDGRVDVAVIPTADPVGLASVAGPDLQTEVVTRVPLALVAPRALATELGSGPVRIERLLDHTWILPRRVPEQRILPETLDEVFARAGRRPARVVDVSTPHTALPLVADGLGVTVTSLGVAQHLPSLAIVPVRGGLPDLALVLLSRRESCLAPVAQRFVDFVLEQRGADRG